MRNKLLDVREGHHVGYGACQLVYELGMKMASTLLSFLAYYFPVNEK